jgi:deoxyribonuclease-4
MVSQVLLDIVNWLSFQLFLGGALSSKLSIKDEDLAQSAQNMNGSSLRLFVHSPYIINLCSTPGEKDDYGVHLLRKNLQYASLVGCKGVVVHVGKYTTKDPSIALAHMRANIHAVLDAATPTCPLLLETPAGQGTEMLRSWEEFVEFVAGFNDPRFAICVDTCHVFACGHNPLHYIERLTRERPSLLKLVHYNDSATPCGSCLDRHAWFGTGHIGMETMTHIANHCRDNSYPMVVE